MASFGARTSTAGSKKRKKFDRKNKQKSCGETDTEMEELNDEHMASFGEKTSTAGSKKRKKFDRKNKQKSCGETDTEMEELNDEHMASFGEKTSTSGSKTRKKFDRKNKQKSCGETDTEMEEFKIRLNIALRKMGDDRHNREVLKEGEGEIILARRPKTTFDITLYGPCPDCTDCREWVLLKGLKNHNNQCTKNFNLKKKRRKKDVIIKSQILGGHIRKTKPTPIMQKEVLPIMTSDEVSDIAQNDSLILALGESWLRRNVGNPEKRKYYASARMRLSARFLINLRCIQESKKNEDTEAHPYELKEGTSVNNENSKIKSTRQTQKSLWDFLKPQHFGDIVIAAIRCSYPNAEDDEELLSPSNAIKLKYDINRLICSKWGFIVQECGDSNSKEAVECDILLNLMSRQWKERVTNTARNVLNLRKFQEIKELPSPEDIQNITTYLVQKRQEISLTPDNFHTVVSIAQTRLLLYNRRRTGELEVIKLQSFASRSKGLQDLDESLAKDLTPVEKHLAEKQDLMTVIGKVNRKP